MQFRREDGTIVVRVKSYIPAKFVADTNAHICFSLFYTDHGLEEYVFILAKIAVERPCLTCVLFVQGARGSPKRPMGPKKDSCRSSTFRTPTVSKLTVAFNRYALAVSGF